MPDVTELTAYDRYVLRNVIVHELSLWQPDMDSYIQHILEKRPGKPRGRLAKVDNCKLFFQCWIDLALRVTNIPNRSETSEYMVWDPEDKKAYNAEFDEEEDEDGELREEDGASSSEDDEEKEKELPKGFKSKLVFRNKRFHRIWFHDKVGVNSHLPMIIPISDTISYYLSFYLLHLRKSNGLYLFNGEFTWKHVASDLKMFIRDHLGLGIIIQDYLIHNMRHLVADTIGIVTNFNMAIMKDVSLVMRHTHQMQQKRYATGTKWGQVSSSLHDHQSYQPDRVKLWYPSNDLTTMVTWEDMSEAIKQKRFIWGTTIVTNLIPIAKLQKSTPMDRLPLFQHFQLSPRLQPTTLQESLEACFPNRNIQVDPNRFFSMKIWKEFHLKRER